MESATTSMLPEECLVPVMAHVLFTDIVGYSTLHAEDQSKSLQELQDAVRSSTEYLKAQNANGLIRNPTGDGMALVFFEDPLAPIRCATEIAQHLRRDGNLGLRMGLHSGLVYRITDINGKENVVGEGINTAQRVMDCGDAGHVLVSATQAQFLGSLGRWKSLLHELGIAEVKHGVKLNIFSVHGEALGNAERPKKFRSDAAPLVQRASSPVEARLAQTRVALIYKRGQQPDEQLLAALDRALQQAGCSVFVDRKLCTGLDWARNIETTLREVDAVVPLLSPASVESEMLHFELQIAEEAFQRTGKPRFLPVRVDWEGPLPPALATILSRYQYALWRSGSDVIALAAEIVRGLGGSPAPKAEVLSRHLDPPGGAVPLNSRFYIERTTDQECLEALARQDSFILLEGARQMGKTSLISRALREARKTSARVVFTDFQRLNESDLVSLDGFYRCLAATLADQLELETMPEDIWRPQRTPNRNFESYVKQAVLGKTDKPLIWALDEVDRLFPASFAGEVFGLFRSWHNSRAMDPDGPWGNLTMLIAYATEVHLFIGDLNQSPFNVGTRVRLRDFSLEEAAELNRRHGEPLTEPAKVLLLHRQLGGQPYLLRRAFHELVAKHLTLEQLLSTAATDDGCFGDHLRRILVLLTRDDFLVAAMRAMLAGQALNDPQIFYRLRSAGVVRGARAQEAQFRCEIYSEYLRLHLS